MARPPPKIILYFSYKIYVATLFLTLFHSKSFDSGIMEIIDYTL